MTSNDKFSINDRLFVYNDITSDKLLAFISKESDPINIIKILQDPNIDNRKKEKIMVLIAELYDKKYIKEQSSQRLIKITFKGRWRLLYINPTLTFWGFVLAVAGIIISIILTIK